MQHVQELAATYIARPLLCAHAGRLERLAARRTWCLVGGEPAAAVLTDYLRPGVLTLYGEKVPGLLAARQKFLKEPAPGHTAVVEVRKRFWNFPGDPQHNNLVPPLLVYADLLATGDARCIETARMIYDAYVARSLTEG